ncbi:MAG: helix-hairpin-helix domain-containing protein [Acetatifactor sp.]|nr:helix-hairpin-helix domain-containing protein [Acetatifactor sp.]
MMKRIKKTIIHMLFLILLGLSSCGRDDGIVYFGTAAADDAYTQGAGEDVTELTEPETVSAQEEQICVHVCGQVCRPGVVMLPAGSRAWEAVEASGGLTEDAQEAAVNLAAALEDGQKLYIPALGESVTEETAETADNGRVNLNTADADRLQTLSGIGAGRAADILSYRETHGGFQSIEEIMQVPGIKESIYEKIKDKITVD